MKVILSYYLKILSSIMGIRFNSFKSRLVGAIVVINFLVLFLAGYSSYTGKTQHDTQAMIATENITRILEQNISGVLDAVDLALFSEKVEAERQLATGAIDTNSFDKHLSNILQRIPELNNLRLADAKGEIYYGLAKDENAANVADREYFTTLRDTPGLAMTISKPLLSRVSKKWIIIVARRVNAPDGSFAGVIHGNIPLDYFKDLFSTVKIGTRGIITLRSEDLTIFLRYPETATSAPGSPTVSKELTNIAARGEKSATYRTVSPIDGIARLFSYRKIADYPLYINCGIAPQDYLHFWRIETANLLVMYIIFLLSTLFATRFVMHTWNERQQYLDNLHVLNENLELRVDERTKDLQFERQRLADILYGSNDGIWDWNITNGTLTVNNRWAEILGHTLEELFPLTVKTWEEHVHPDDVAFAYEEIGKCLKGVVPSFAIEYRMITKTGCIIWNLDRGKVVERDENGKAVRAAGTHTDVTSRKLADEALKQSDAKVRLLLNSTAEAIYGIDLQGNCTFANQSCLRMIGYTDQEQLLGRNMHDLIHHSYPNRNPMPETNCRIFQAFREGKGTHVEDEVLWRADGTSFPVEYWSHPQVLDDMVMGAVVTFNDISARMQAQEQLALKQEQLELLNLSLQKQVQETVAELRLKDQVLIIQGRQAAMGEMIGNIAHQWRQPLNVLAMVIFNLQCAHQDRELTDAYMNESAATANRLIQKMSATINDFRNFFNPDKEQVAFSAREQIKYAVEMVAAALENATITIAVASGDDCSLFGFPNEYSQVLLNLLSNAKDAIVESEALPGQIAITLTEQDGMGVVSVRDNGGGIPEAISSKIFEPYFSTKSMGTGIGLYMSKMIIERNMKGRLEVQTIEGGCEFSVYVPLAEKTS